MREQPSHGSICHRWCEVAIWEQSGAAESLTLLGRPKNGHSLVTPADVGLTTTLHVTLYSEQRVSIDKILLIGRTACIERRVRLRDAVDPQTTLTNDREPTVLTTAIAEQRGND